MTIYTSNYTRQCDNPKSVAISRKPPEWYKGGHLIELSPTWDIITALRSGKIDEAQYTKEYLLQLKQRKIDPELITQLPDGTMLLCYESPTDFCHRHILTMWIENKTGVIIPEWKNEKEEKANEQDQLVDDLFGLQYNYSSRI